MLDYLPFLQRLPRYFERRKTAISYGLTFEAYSEIPAINASVLKEPTAAHMLHVSCTGHETTPALDNGTLVHAAILEPEKFPKLYIILPDDAPRKPSAKQRNAKKPSAETLAAIEFWDDFNKRAAGRIQVTAEEIDIIEQQREAVMKHHFARTLIEAPGHNEATIETWDDEMQIMRKSRYDRLPGAGASFLLDIKTTRHELHPWAILSEVRSRGYALQCRSYMDVLNLASNDTRRQFYLIFVRNVAPFICRVFELNEDLPGRNLLEEASSQLYANDSTQPGRLPMFVSAAREFMQRIQEKHQDPLGAWDAYENEPAQLLLP